MSMKAIVYSNYGSPDVLKCEDIEKPAPAGNEVLIKVRAASLNPLDWHFMRGTPYFLRLMAGLIRPKSRRLGVDVSGQIEALGKDVTQFKPGDEVFGTCREAFAEYACASESALIRKPQSVTFEQAASAPIAALSALQSLRLGGWSDKGQAQPRQRVLINGAAGGVGTFAVQIAKHFGADVTGVCSTRNVGMVRSIGADRVIDYTQEDFTKGAQRYDTFLDCVGNRSLLACQRILSPKGTYVTIAGDAGRWMIGPLARAIAALVLSKFGSRRLVPLFLAKSNQPDLTIISGLMKAGTVTPVIDKRYQLDEVPEAIRYLEQGHARGKVVITVG
jgi:NADPH:quinone reductase-like Zn-dependent oxidoreductase